MVSHSNQTADPAAALGVYTYAEIFQQCDLWPVTFDIVSRRSLQAKGPVVVTGAGTSAYAAAAVAAAWPGARAIPTTDLLIETRADLERRFPAFVEGGLLISLGRSGDSPESVAVVERMQRACPQVRHIAITCNPDGGLAHMPGVEAIVLDPRTNDRSLVMTSSFSNLVLAGLCLRFGAEIGAVLPNACSAVAGLLPQYDALAARLASLELQRAVILAAGSLAPLADEASLKILEMTAGRIATQAETFLGLRHGPMSFLTPDTLVLCFLSSSPRRQQFEQDLVAELRQKQLGRLVGILPESADRSLFDEWIPASTGRVADEFRVPFEIPFAQLLGYHLSLQAGLDPDNPSPKGAITRVVPKFMIHDVESQV